MSLIEQLLQPVLQHASVKMLLGEVSAPEGRGEIALSGLTGTAKALLVAGMAHAVERPIVVFTQDNESAERLRTTTATFLEWLEAGTPSPAGGTPARPGALTVLPAFDVSPYEARSPHAELLEQRAVALWNIARGRTRILFVPMAAALARFRDASFYGSLALELKPGDELSLDDLTEHLATVGYEAIEPVTSVGQYSVRGGIIDVFSPEAERPVRLEFFGDSIESLRQFDPASQRSLRSLPSVALLPLAETPRSPRFFAALVETLSRRASEQRPSPGREPDWAAEYSSPFPGWEFFISLVEPHPNTVLSLVRSVPAAARARPPLVVWDEKLERVQHLTRTLEGLAVSFDEVRDIVPPRPRPVDLFLTEQEFSESVGKAGQIDLKELALSPAPRELVLPTQTAPKFHGAVKAFVEDVKTRLAGGEQVVCVVPTTGKAERLREIFSEYQVPFSSAKDAPAVPLVPRSPLTSAPILIVRGQIDSGAAFPELRLLLFSDDDLFGGLDFGAPARREKSAAASFISDLSDLKVGDYVVHVDHGIALYQGLRQIEVEGATRDFMLLTYQEDAKLYVPLERLDLIEKYRAGGDGAKPVLDRLGGVTWARTKSRVKRALRDMAEDLLRLYAERKMHGGQAYSLDTPWQQEFENGFEFDETPDQLTALADIKRDLESPQPMDRLLCGDVGYGKTELAMRAAFKVVQDGRQVAVLAPTTVLAFQHSNTFSRRMAGFPVRIEMISRFRTTAEIKKALAETEAGKVDILIGTHRLLSKDVSFHSLGLLIVDEEQRFGVAAKEKLKKLRFGIDVLTMSATPIPRTLNMSLGGLRDLSVIETPPRGRLAIQTVVAPFGDGMVQAAILQEMSRQGQVYFVHNRVESIWSMASLVQKLVPTARIGVAHGQMHEKELERVMLKFVQGEYDVLVSTVLIENGLDIPRANTLIVNHAERFGLADLYQLRGRVGRSNRRAYAYFLIPAEDALTPIAKRRLAALKEFSDLGAGFRLAALDLELRGAGNLLGGEQSGHLHSVGIDLYLKMLEETVEELKGAAPKLEVRTTLNLGLDIKIPDEYISDERQRLRMYKRISSLATESARADLEAELVDRYGAIPASVQNLFRYAILKSVAEGLLVESIERRDNEVWMRFHARAPVDPAKLKQFLGRHRESTFRPDGVLRFRMARGDGELPGEIQNVLQELHA
ncbi:MAG TPA: transcription-repair coupling factor [Terriglobia bacterium]|nr:transcription-repair coupling factor [Terriglobia bacterium]